MHTVTKTSLPAKTPEWRLQGAAVTALKRKRDAGWPIRVAGDMNAGRRSPAERGKAIATGMNAGEPDLRVYLPGGRLLLIEYKAKGGSVSVEQKAAHAELKVLGFDVVIVQPANEAEAADLTVALVAARLSAANDNNPIKVAKVA